MIFITLLIILFIMVLIFFLIYEFYPRQTNKSYEFQLPIKGDGANKNICPKGCIRGVCEKKNGSKCKHDYNCNYCRDETTNMFYVNSSLQNEDKILPEYEESKKITKSSRDILNEKILANNLYIDNLNNKIKEINH